MPPILQKGPARVLKTDPTKAWHQTRGGEQEVETSPRLTRTPIGGLASKLVLDGDKKVRGHPPEKGIRSKGFESRLSLADSAESLSLSLVEDRHQAAA
jgi:hypothetical protein